MSTEFEELWKWMLSDRSQASNCYSGWLHRRKRGGQNDPCGDELELETSVRTHAYFNVDYYMQKYF